jgi:hypothetical protein
VAGKGVWSDASVDPIKELDDQILAISNANGVMPNRMVIGIGTEAVLRHHPKVIARQPGSANTHHPPAAFGHADGAAGDPSGRPLEGQAKAGKAKNAVNIVGDSLYIYTRRSRPRSTIRRSARRSASRAAA